MTMNDTMKKALDCQLSQVKWTAEDAQAVCRRMQEASKTTRRKWPAGLVLVAALMLAATVALAMAQEHGLLDFLHHYNAFIPCDAQQYVQTNVATFDHELVTLHVRESYYDGRTLRLTLDVVPKEANVLLLGSTARFDDAWQDVINLEAGAGDPSDTRQVKDVISPNTKLYRVSVEGKAEGVWPMPPGHSGFENYVLDPETGVLTFYHQELFGDDQPQRRVELEVKLSQYPGEAKDKAVYTHTLEVTSAAVETPTYVSETVVDYPQAGAQITRLLLEVKPQEIYYAIEFTALEYQLTPHRKSSAVLFEFVDAGSQVKKLPYGLIGTYGVRPVGENRYVQWGTLGREELHESYQLRAYNADDRTRYETMTIPVTLVKAE